MVYFFFRLFFAGFSISARAFTISTACSSSAHAIGEAMLAIRTGRADAVITVGADASITPLVFAGFCSLRALSTGFNDMHFFSHHLHIPTLGYGPGGEDYHAVDERAKVRELLASAKIYAALMTEFAG